MLTSTNAHATLPASDLDRARRFYEGTLGFLPARAGKEGVLYETTDGNGFLLFPSAGKASGTHTQMSFRVDDLDAEVHSLKERGVRFEALDMEGFDPETSIVSMGSTRGAWFRDPEGNLLAVTEDWRDIL
jgi:catechol 2,3-dioxygenase-like lactoylglutathione lyase family enzyme